MGNNIGEKSTKEIFFGDKAVEAIMLGSTPIWEKSKGYRYVGIYVVKFDTNTLSQIEFTLADNGLDISTPDPSSIIDGLLDNNGDDEYTNGDLSDNRNVSDGDFIYFDLGAGNEATPLFVRVGFDRTAFNPKDTILQVRVSNDASTWVSTGDIQMGKHSTRAAFTENNYVAIAF